MNILIFLNILESATSYLVPLATEMFKLAFLCHGLNRHRKGLLLSIKIGNKLQLAKTLRKVATDFLYFIFIPRRNSWDKLLFICLRTSLLPFSPYGLCFPSELVLSQYKTVFVRGSITGVMWESEHMGKNERRCASVCENAKGRVWVLCEQVAT